MAAANEALGGLQLPIVPPVAQHPKDVPHDFICSLCHELPLDPVLTPCEHVFCRECAVKALSHWSECPIDRRPLNREHLKALDGILRRVYEQIAVKCPNVDCGWCGTVGNYAAHARLCRSGKTAHLEEMMEEMQVRIDSLVAENTSLMLENKEKERNIVKLATKLEESAALKFDRSYSYKRERVVELSQLICRYLENKPLEINRNRIFDCVKSCYNDLCMGYRDNPAHYHTDMRMLINICRASTWFSHKQSGNLYRWASEQGW